MFYFLSRNIMFITYKILSFLGEIIMENSHVERHRRYEVYGNFPNDLFQVKFLPDYTLEEVKYR